MWKRAFLVGLMAGLTGVVACSQTPDEPLSKAEVAQALGEGADLGTVCVDYGWLEDGFCDPWCPTPDPECEETEVICAQFIEEPNGFCSRLEDDPCRFQDPDCEMIACPAIAMEPDGVCSLPPDDPCQFIDPDCGGGGEEGCDYYLEAPDGVCSRPDDDPCRFQDPDCDIIACPALYMEPDGVCSLPDSDPCQFIDTDCV